MNSKTYQWPKGEKLAFVRPPVEEYHGNLECFYDPDIFPELKPLKDNWTGIREEIEAYERNNGLMAEMDSYTPPENTENQWSHIYLMSYLWKFHKNQKKFPFLTSIVNQIPNCTYATISVLPPNTVIKPHYGDTNGVLRSHLGIIIPDKLPNIGIKVGEEERDWSEGELLCFSIVKKHKAWNKSDKRRYIVILDFVPQGHPYSIMQVCSKTLGSQSFTFLYNKFSLVRKLPESINQFLCDGFGLFWRLYLPIQRRFKFL